MAQAQGRDVTDNAFLAAAREEAKAHEQETRLAATAANDLLGRPMAVRIKHHLAVGLAVRWTDPGPIIPRLYANGSPSSNVARLANMIPISHEFVDSRASTANTAFTALQATEDSFRKGQSHLADVLKSFERLNGLRQSFVASVRDYNQTIAEYSLTVVDTSVDRQTLVSTLIRTPFKLVRRVPSLGVQHGPPLTIRNHIILRRLVTTPSITLERAPALPAEMRWGDSQ